MSKKEVEKLLIAGGEDRSVQARYDAIKTKENFVAQAVADGYQFTEAELDAVLQESGDAFDLIGNPAKRQIWWR